MDSDISAYTLCGGVLVKLIEYYIKRNCSLAFHVGGGSVRI